MLAFAGMFLALAAYSQNQAGVDWRYTVRPKDTVSSLTNQYLKPSVTWREVARHNQLKDANRIQVGTQLRIPLQWLAAKRAQARLTSVSGDVQIKALDGTWQPALSGATLQTGQKVKVGVNSSARLLFADDSLLHIQPKTTVTMDTLSVYADGFMVDTQLRLQEGRVEVYANPKGRPGQKFDVITPAAVASVRGTQFMVEAHQSRTVQQTNAGQVALQTSFGDVLVPEDFGSLVNLGAKPSPPELIKPAPVLQNPSTQFLKFPIDFQWAPKEDVATWIMQVALDPQMAQLVFTQQSEHPFLDLGGIADGTYYLRAWSVDAAGMPSKTSLHPFAVAIPRKLQGPAIQIASRYISTSPMAVELPPLLPQQRYWVQITQDPEGLKPVWHQPIPHVTFAVPVLPAQNLPYHLWVWIY